MDTHGGELVSLQDGSGTEYIWGGDPAFWAGRNPVLFPIVGGLKNGTVRFNGRSYAMPRHGFARDNKFSVAEQGKNFVVFELRENEATLKQYPYAFSLQVTHRLEESGFSTSFRIKNAGVEPMPFCIGGHTAFRCPLQGGERFEDYEVVFDRPEQADLILLTQDGLVSHEKREPFLHEEDRFMLDRDSFARLDTMILENLRSTGVSLRHRKSGHGVHLDFTGFPMIGFWTKAEPAAPFFCMEPWQGCTAVDNESGEFTDKPYCTVLAPGESKRLGYTVSLF